MPHLSLSLTHTLTHTHTPTQTQCVPDAMPHFSLPHTHTFSHTRTQTLTYKRKHGISTRTRRLSQSQCLISLPVSLSHTHTHTYTYTHTLMQARHFRAYTTCVPVLMPHPSWLHALIPSSRMPPLPPPSHRGGDGCRGFCGYM